jgi:RNA polymerase sigma factor (sigma-70 family)
VEASAIPATVGLARTRIAIGAPLLRIRSDEQLVSLFRSGSEEAFHAIHDRYRQRLFAYTRQMLAGSAADAEDAVQEIFVRAYAGLRANHRQLALRAWLYRIAHNRCVDELRRPQAQTCEEIPATIPNTTNDPVTRTEQRDVLRRLIADVQRLPDQQRSALLMRELGGMTYADVSGALGVSVPAVKSLLVRARVGLAQANEARDTACARIREDLIVAHDRGVRTSGLARRHMRDCPSCRQFRSEVRGVSRQLAAFVPALGPIGLLAKLLGIGGAGGSGAAAGGTAVAGGGATAATGAAGTGAAAASVGAIAGAGHVVTILAAAVVTAGGAIELQHISPRVAHPAHHHRVVSRPGTPATSPGATDSDATPASTAAGTGATPSTAVTSPGPAAPAGQGQTAAHTTTPSSQVAKAVARSAVRALTISETIDPDNMNYAPNGTNATTTTPVSTAPGSTTTPAASTPTGTSSTPTGTVSPPTTAPSGSTPAPVTGALPPTTTTGTPAGTTGSSTGTPTSTGSTGSDGSTTSAGGSTTVVPATSSGSISPSTPTAGRDHHGGRHGTIAVFTVTGN